MKITIPYLIRKRASFLRLKLKTSLTVMNVLSYIYIFLHDSNFFLFKLMRRYRYTFEVKRGYGVASDVPALYIETINQCNAHCFMCPIHKLSRPVGYMEYDLYQKVINEYAQLGKSILLSNYGEPLLDPLLIKRIKYAKSKGLRVEFFTNGLLLNKNMSKDLLECGLDSLIVSMYAARSQTYKRIYGCESLEKVTKNIQLFLQLRKADYKQINTKINLKWLIMNENKEEVSCFVKEWKSKVDFINIGVGLSSRAGSIEFANVKNRVHQLYKRANPCVWPFHGLIILPNGDVTICCEDWDGKAIVGNVQHSTILNIWNSDKIKQIREYMLKCDWKLVPSICKRCDRPLQPSLSSWWM